MDRDISLLLSIKPGMSWDDVNEIWNHAAAFFKKHDEIDEVRLSVAGVENIDSLSLNYLVMLRGYALERGGDFILMDVGDDLYRIITMLQLHKKFTIIRATSE